MINVPVYDFSKPEDVATYWQTLPNKGSKKMWWRMLEREHGKEFMKQVYKIVNGESG